MEKFTNIKKKSNVKRIFENEENPFKRSTGLVLDKEIKKSEPSKFFSKLFEARQMAHVYHLQVRGDEGSHAAHKALDDFYTELLDLLDEIVEVYQGQYDIVEGYDIIDSSPAERGDRIQYFIEVAQFIKSTRNLAFLEEDTHIHSLVDDILNLTYKLIYKLKFNK
jgi:hypothetical protein